jgi:hypothetical protein
MTRAEAIRQVLENLRVIDQTANPDADDALAVGKRLDQARSFLTEKGLCWWDAESIPDSVAGPFADLVAERSCNIFGKTYAAPNALKEIAGIKSSEAREAVSAQYF